MVWFSIFLYGNWKSVFSSRWKRGFKCSVSVGKWNFYFAKTAMVTMMHLYINGRYTPIPHTHTNHIDTDKAIERRRICKTIIIAFELVMQIINNNKEDFYFRNVFKWDSVCCLALSCEWLLVSVYKKNNREKSWKIMYKMDLSVSKWNESYCHTRQQQSHAFATLFSFRFCWFSQFHTDFFWIYFYFTWNVCTFLPSTRINTFFLRISINDNATVCDLHTFCLCCRYASEMSKN